MADENLAEVVEEVPAVGDLEGVRCALGDRSGVLRRAVPSHDLDTGMILEPRRDGRRCPVRQEIDGPSPLEVDEDRAPRSALPPGPIVNAEHAWCLGGRGRVPVDEPEDRVGARRHPEVPEQSRPGFCADSEAGPDLGGGETVGPACMASNEVWERLRERLSWARRVQGQRNRRTRRRSPTARSLTGRSLGERV